VSTRIETGGYVRQSIQGLRLRRHFLLRASWSHHNMNV